MAARERSNHEDHPNYQILKHALETRNLSNNVSELFNELTDYGNFSLTRDAISLMMEYIDDLEKETSDRFYKKIYADFFMKDGYHLQRSDIVENLPVIFKSLRFLRHEVSLYLSDVVVARNDEEFHISKNALGNWLILFPIAAMYRNIPFDENLKILGYLEYLVEPTYNSNALVISNDMFSEIIKKTPREEFRKVYYLIKKSKSYSYIHTMAILFHRIVEGSFTLRDGVKFIVRKSVVCNNNPIFGHVPDDLAIRIQMLFLSKLIEKEDILSVESAINKIHSGAHMDNAILSAVASIKIKNLNQIVNGYVSFDNLLYQSVLSKYVKGSRNDILKMALTFAKWAPVMSSEERCQYFAILAANSHPKENCEHRGTLVLFEVLFARLMDMLPKRTTTHWTVDSSEYENILFAIYNLYTIDDTLRILMDQIDEDWIAKVRRAVDFHVVTSDNMMYLLELEECPIGTKFLQRQQKVVTNTGQILIFLFGVLNNRNLTITPRYMSEWDCFDEDLFTSSYRNTCMISMTFIQIRQDRQITLPHRNTFRWPVMMRFDRLCCNQSGLNVAGLNQEHFCNELSGYIESELHSDYEEYDFERARPAYNQSLEKILTDIFQEIQYNFEIWDLWLNLNAIGDQKRMLTSNLRRILYN